MEQSSTLVRCPVCRNTFDPSESTAMPFCSDRCRLVDLGRWMGERYAVPSDRADDDLDALTGDETDSGSE
jgi:endogenous inhibitor of DNA gyrase (YacG/DUF329 family)